MGGGAGCSRADTGGTRTEGKDQGDNSRNSPVRAPLNLSPAQNPHQGSKAPVKGRWAWPPHQHHSLERPSCYHHRGRSPLTCPEAPASPASARLSRPPPPPASPGGLRRVKASLVCLRRQLQGRAAQQPAPGAVAGGGGGGIVPDAPQHPGMEGMAGLGWMGPRTHPESRGVTALANSAWSSDLTATHPRGLYASRTITTWKPREAEAQPATALASRPQHVTLLSRRRPRVGPQYPALRSRRAPGPTPPAETTVSGATCLLG